MALLDDIKAALRVDGTSSDTEVGDLIAACKVDLGLAGVDISGTPDTDAFLKVAIVQFCKAHYDNAGDADKYLAAYESMKVQMACSTLYRKAAT